MKALLVYPKYPVSFWSFHYALKFISVKAVHPPLGLLTVAAMLPGTWVRRVVDLNVRPLLDADLQWADMVFISAMAIQADSVREVVARCKSAGLKIVAGGPLFTIDAAEFADIDHLILNEAETTLPAFLSDLANGSPRNVYTSGGHPGLETTPLPAWDLIRMDDYATMSIQYSRGCPYDCEFCGITKLYGRKMRTKSAEQFVAEIDALYDRGWRETVFVVDDNFVANKAKLKAETLPAMIRWTREHNRPFDFVTEASINMADDKELMELMVEAGFAQVFIGIETPSEESLIECNKFNNVNRDLLASVKKIQGYGISVSAGFIVGFDADTATIFDRQIDFIQRSGIVTAMVGLLNAPKGTRLFERLKQENRILHGFSGNNTDFSLNFIPVMDAQSLIDGYRRIVTTIYSPAQYYDRILEMFNQLKPIKRGIISRFRLRYIKSLLMVMFYLGILDKGRKYYWRLLLKTLRKHPGHLVDAMVLSVYGVHFRKIFNI